MNPYILDYLPESIRLRSIYIIGEKENFWMLSFLCPCGCGELIQLNTVPDTYPSWSFEIYENNMISIYPSIRRKRGCFSHFSIQKSMVVWINEIEF